MNAKEANVKEGALDKSVPNGKRQFNKAEWKANPNYAARSTRNWASDSDTVSGSFWAVVAP